MGLLMGQATVSNYNDKLTQYPGCVQNLFYGDATVQQQVEEWILSLYSYSSPETIANAFEAATFLANEAWLLKSAVDPTLYVSYDMGYLKSC